MNFEVHTYGNGLFIHKVFEYVAMIFGNNSYSTLMNIVALVAFIAVLGKVALSRDGLHIFRSYFGIVFLVLIAFVPKNNVIITDDIVPANSSVVSNVPFGLAVTAGTFSGIGYWLTNAYETVTANVSASRTTETGFLFHQEVLNRANYAGLRNYTTRYNFQQFVNSCVISDGIGHDRFTWDDLMKTNDIDAFLKKNLNNSDTSQFFYIQGSTNAYEPVAPSTLRTRASARCRDGYINIISPAISTNVLHTIPELAQPMSEKFPNRAMAINFVGSKLNELNHTIFQASNSNWLHYVKQKTLVNELDRSVAVFAQDVEADASANYIRDKSDFERSITFEMTMRTAVEKLPKLRMIIEGVLYAIFPIIALLAIISPVKAIVGYAKALIWINLWSPMFAILNSARLFYDEKNLESLTGLYGGVSAEAMTHINQYLAEASNITAGLMISLPMITWMLLSMSGAMMAGFAGRVLGGFEQAVQGASQEITDGRGTYAGADWKQNTSQDALTNTALSKNSSTSDINTMAQSQPTASTPGYAKVGSDAGFNYSFQDRSGNMVSVSSGGLVQTQVAKSQGHYNYQVSEQTREQVSSAYEESIAHASTTEQSYNQAVSSQLSLMNSVGSQVQQQANRTDGTQYTSQQTVNNMLSTITSSVDRHAESKGMTDQERTALTAAVSASFGLQGGGTGAGIGGTGQTGTTSMNTHQKQQVQEYMNSEEGRTTRSEMNSLMTSKSFAQQHSIGETLRQELQASHSVVQSHASKVAEARQEVAKATHAVNMVNELSNSTSEERTSAMLNQHIKERAVDGVSPGQATQEFLQLQEKAYYQNDADAKFELDELARRLVFSEEEVRQTYDTNVTNLKSASDERLKVVADKADKVVDEGADRNRARVGAKSSEYGISENGVKSKVVAPTETVDVNSGSLGSGKGGVSNAGVGKVDGSSTLGRVAEKTGMQIEEVTDQAYDFTVDKTAQFADNVAEKVQEFKDDPVGTTKNTVTENALKPLTGMVYALKKAEDFKDNVAERMEFFDGQNKDNK